MTETCVVVYISICGHEGSNVKAYRG